MKEDTKRKQRKQQKYRKGKSREYEPTVGYERENGQTNELTVSDWIEPPPWMKNPQRHNHRGNNC